MQTTPNKRLLFLLPSVSALLFLMTFLLLSFPMGQRLLADGDTGYHIRAGDVMLREGRVLKEDVFSFLSPPLEWVAHEWLAEILMALVHRSLGLSGIVVLFAFLIALAYVVLYRVVRVQTGAALAAAVVILAMLSSLHHWLARPHIFTLLFTALYVLLLDDSQKKNQKRLYLLPLLMIPWVNLHGGYIIGLMLIGIHWVGSLGQQYRVQVSHLGSNQPVPTVPGTVPLLTLAAAMINPRGWEILKFPFRMVTDPILTWNIQEFLATDLGSFHLFRYLLLGMVAVLALSRSPLNAVEFLLFLSFAAMALASVRHIPLFLIVAAPIVTKTFQGILDLQQGRWIEAFRRFSQRAALAESKAAGHSWPVFAVIIVTVAAAAGRLHYEFDPVRFPKQAVSFLRQEKIPGNMFASDTFGNYLIYAAWPDYKVFIDGRSDMYGREVIEDYLKVVNLSPAWERVLEKYRIGWILEPAASPLSVFLMSQPEWKRLYADPAAWIFVKSERTKP